MTTFRRTLALPAVVLALAVPGVAGAQGDAGQIVGQVIDRSSERPLAAAQVFVVGTQSGARTDDEGRYRIAGVSAGQVAVRVARIGFQSITRTVLVEAGQSVTVDFALTATPVQLDAVVTTATGEVQRRRESGASVDVVDTTRINIAAVTNFSDVLASRTAGVSVIGATGTTGTNSRIRIRGANSISLANDPLIIVDGVRVNAAADAFSVGVGGQTISSINDINPEEIESYEVIKGPAAAALYGTAAANGVIQITTKRGRAGRTVWNAHAEAGTLRNVAEFPDNFNQLGRRGTGTDTTTFSGCTLIQQANGACRPDRLISFNPLETYSPLRTGENTSAGLSVSGGTVAGTYFISGEYEREQGITEPNKLNRVSFRSNFSAQPRPNLDAKVTAGFTRSQLALPFNDNSGLGFISAGLLGSATDNPVTKGYFSRFPGEFFFIDNAQEVNRFTSGVSSNWQPIPWLRAYGQAGLDLIARHDRQTVPSNKTNYSQGLQEGSAFSQRFSLPTYSAQLSGTASYGIPGTSSLTGKTVVGTQFIREEQHATSGFGRLLLAGTGNLNGASAGFAVGASDQAIVTIAGLASQELAWNDRLFLTASLRADDNSAFGSSFGLVYYPAASLSYVISEEPFFPKTDVISQLRLRSAYGRSGQRPGFRQATTFFNPVSVRAGGTELPAVTVGGTGNALLEPETSAEYEVGFEAGFFNELFGLDVTYYDKTTSAALIQQRLAPSLGATVSRFVNLGKVSNKGIEVLLRSTPVTNDLARLDLTLSYSNNKNRLLDLGEGIPPIIFGTQRHVEGSPLGAYYDEVIRSYADLDGNGYLSRNEVSVDSVATYLGSSQPTRELSFSSSLSLFNVARLNVVLDYRGGHKLFNQTAEFRCASFTRCRAAYDRSAPLEDQAAYLARALYNTSAGYIENADFVKLREVALTLSLPKGWAARTRTDALSLTLAGRNLKTWTDYSGFDPEVNWAATTNFTSIDFLTQPPVRRFTARLNVAF